MPSSSTRATRGATSRSRRRQRLNLARGATSSMRAGVPSRTSRMAILQVPTRRRRLSRPLLPIHQATAPAGSCMRVGGSPTWGLASINLATPGHPQCRRERRGQLSRGTRGLSLLRSRNISGPHPQSRRHRIQLCHPIGVTSSHYQAQLGHRTHLPSLPHHPRSRPNGESASRMRPRRPTPGPEASPTPPWSHHRHQKASPPYHPPKYQRHAVSRARP